MSETYSKECPICGGHFTTTSKIRIYCNNCSNHSTQKYNQMLQAIERNKRKYPINNYITYTCEYCGKEHNIQPKLLYKVKLGHNSSWDGQDHLYCCVQHKEKDRHDHDYCAYCGKTLKGTDYSYSTCRPNNFCSTECEQAHERQVAQERGWIRNCVRCGKEYIRKTDKPSYFCCKECQQAAVKDGWVSPNAPKRPGKEIVTQACVICGKEFTREYTPSMHRVMTCSRKCANVWSGRQVKEHYEGGNYI